MRSLLHPAAPAHAAAKTLGLCLATTLLGAGCELSRPEGAFEPVYPNADEKPDDPNAGDDAGAVDNPDVFEDASVSAKDEKYKELVGTYLARFDEVSAATTKLPSPLSAITTKNILSRFFLIRIEESEDGTELLSTEQLCGQASISRCMEDCSSTTTLFAKAASLIPTSSPIKRQLRLTEDKEGKLNALTDDDTVTYLGYKATADNRGLPDSLQDQRLWPGAKSGQEGLYTSLHLTAMGPPPLSFKLDATCELNIVQQLSYNWLVFTRSEADDPFVLDGKVGSFTTVGTHSAIIGAKAFGGQIKDDDCRPSDDDGTLGTPDYIAKFVKTELTKCPKTADFDKLIPRLRDL